MEWRRIVAKKQFLLGIVLLGLLGLVFFLQSIALDFRSEQEMFGVNFFQAVEARKETLRQLRQLPAKEAAIQTEEAITSGEWTITIYERTRLAEQAAHVAGYAEYLNTVQTSAEQMRHIPAMYRAGSFSAANIDKTAADFARIQGTVGALTLMQAESVTAVTDSGIAGIAYLAMLIALVLMLTEENRNGLRRLIVSCRDGRQVLTARRLGLFAAYAFAVGVIYYGLLFACAWAAYGVPDFTAPVQSVAAFARCVLPLSVGGYLLLYLLGKIAACILVALAVWVFLALFSNLLETILVVGGIGIAEFLLNTLIPVQSLANWGKFLNVFQLLRTEEWFSRYQNLNLNISKL